MRDLRRGIIVAALGIGLAAASAEPVLAEPARPATISIKLTSGITLFGDVVVQWANKKFETVKVSGAISSARAGEVLKLFAQPFPFRAAPQAVRGQSKTLRGSGTGVRYVFDGRPHVATRYSVRAFPARTAKTPEAASAAETAYVVAHQTYAGFRSCNTRGNRPVCHQTLKLYTQVPAFALKLESAKHLYVYFGITLGPRLPLPPPKTLSLINASVSKARRLSATKYEQILKFSFRVNNAAYFPAFTYCTKDTETKDGLNLPGHHGCGSLKISSSVIYLG